VKARRHRPHHIIEIEDIDVVIHDDNVFRVQLCTESSHDGHLRLAVRCLFYRDKCDESTACRMGNMDIAYIGNIAPQSIQDLPLAGDAGHKDMIFGHARRDALIHSVGATQVALGDKTFWCAWIGSDAGEFPERAFWLVSPAKNLPFNHDLGAGWVL